ncbi:chemotaxis protein [Vibrio sp. 10N.286.49.B3]|uniref:DUF3379 domain-containing protein n=1 Tax=Vibrio sp. 10N.286.49.B3 TaxID=1880855 RepID=UPI000C81AC3D|nr:DUF3379 domain-containing protein [Vibrio sp. 10N.286.49.B3]PMH41815.1 chemotaxis protein [Vibrio sp. 10N.286.49.B3]
MDDLEFRRRVLSQPKQRDSELLDVINSNESHAKFLDEVMSLDNQIANAMDVDVPDDLADRILFKQSNVDDSNVVKVSFVKRAMTMAASVAFVAGLAMGQINWGNALVSSAHATLADTAMHHVTSEKAFISQVDENVSSQQINTKLSPFAYQFQQNFPYHVYYLNHCGFGESNAMHMVFQGEKGKVTLFLTTVASEQADTFSQDNMQGIIIPIEHSSLILVGENGEDVAKISEKLAPMLKKSS